MRNTENVYECVFFVLRLLETENNVSCMSNCQL